jgi:hypothetical protein
MRRFQTILRSEPSPEQENLVKVDYKLQELKSPRYQNVEQVLDVSISRVHVNWHPVTLNRLIRFIRFHKYPWDVIEDQKLVI